MTTTVNKGHKSVQPLQMSRLFIFPVSRVPSEDWEYAVEFVVYNGFKSSQIPEFSCN